MIIKLEPEDSSNSTVVLLTDHEQVNSLLLNTYEELKTRTDTFLCKVSKTHEQKQLRVSLPRTLSNNLIIATVPSKYTLYYYKESNWVEVTSVVLFDALVIDVKELASACLRPPLSSILNNETVTHLYEIELYVLPNY